MIVAASALQSAGRPRIVGHYHTRHNEYAKGECKVRMNRICGSAIAAGVAGAPEEGPQGVEAARGE